MLMQVVIIIIIISSIGIANKRIEFHSPS